MCNVIALRDGEGDKNTMEHREGHREQVEKMEVLEGHPEEQDVPSELTKGQKENYQAGPRSELEQHSSQRASRSLNETTICGILHMCGRQGTMWQNQLRSEETKVEHF